MCSFWRCTCLSSYTKKQMSPWQMGYAAVPRSQQTGGLLRHRENTVKTPPWKSALLERQIVNMRSNMADNYLCMAVGMLLTAWGSVCQHSIRSLELLIRGAHYNFVLGHGGWDQFGIWECHQKVRGRLPLLETKFCLTVSKMSLEPNLAVTPKSGK